MEPASISSQQHGGQTSLCQRLRGGLWLSMQAQHPCKVHDAMLTQQVHVTGAAVLCKSAGEGTKHCGVRQLCWL